MKYFYRVQVILDAGTDEESSLSFDFPDYIKAGKFAEMAFLAGDLYTVKIHIVENEVTTVNSPGWRYYEEEKKVTKQSLNKLYGYLRDEELRKIKEAYENGASHVYYADTDSVREE